MPDNRSDLPLLARLRVWAAPHLLQARDLTRDIIEDMPLLTRIASHVGLFLLIVFTIAASSVQFGGSTDRGGGPTTDADDQGEIVLPDLPPDNNPIPFFNSTDPIEIQPKHARLDVIQYTVQSGDTVSDIASQFEVSADSILWANGKLEDNPDMLSVGQVLNIPPVSGVLYPVQANDTLKGIADKFKNAKNPSATLIENIKNSEFNQEHHELKGPDYTLTAGQFLMVPGGTKPYVPRVVTAYNGNVPASAARGTGNFGWPVSGRITQKFWARHPGIDIGAPMGSPVRAADAGYVMVATTMRDSKGNYSGYGNYIIINHGNGYLTRYGHLSAFNVETGDSVKKGQVIGRVGSTGNSTGPHLHFEIIRGSVPRNPFSFLP